MEHQPVMLKEVLAYLSGQGGGYFIDCTLGRGGYAAALAERAGEDGLVLAIDWDEAAVKEAEKKFKKNKNIIIVHANYHDLSKIVQEIFKDKPQDMRFDGIVFDLGLSSDQLQDRRRGFSFLADTPLNMAFGAAREGRTREIVNYCGAQELENIIREYGEEKFSRRIAEGIVNFRRHKEITTTGELREIIGKAVPSFYRRGRIHPATRTFQALRIAANDELENLRSALPQAVDLLKTGGRLVVVSYHSLEDRIVKNFFKQESRACICPPEFPVCQCQHRPKMKIIPAGGKKALKPTSEEIKNNPRARSAKMRVGEKLIISRL